MPTPVNTSPTYKETFISQMCTAEEFESMIAELRVRVENTKFPGDIVPRTDSIFLSRFIRVKSYDVGGAFNSIIKYYNYIKKYRAYHENICPSKYADALHSKVYLVLKHRFNGACVVVFRIKEWNPKEIPIMDGQRAIILGAEALLSQVDIQERGISFIFDMKGVRLEHLWYATITEIRRIAEVAMQGMPVRIGALHLVNVPSIFWPVYHFGKRFVSEKVHKLVHFHANLESLHAYFEKEMLPVCLGGDLSEEEAADRHPIEQLIREDVTYEEYWNGAIWKAKYERSSGG